MNLYNPVLFLLWENAIGFAQAEAARNGVRFRVWSQPTRWGVEWWVADVMPRQEVNR